GIWVLNFPCTISKPRGAAEPPAAGTENNDHNPDREASQSVRCAVGIDNLFRSERYEVALRCTVTNLLNKVALYDFLSRFSGTHFVPLRTYQLSLGYSF
ncbi:MAG TPA: hypothetical protein VKG25_24355, partial [Bryobacteraceae bacterium]|nr:hypothetical protein [Bryobacteraceae bacterium]